MQSLRRLRIAKTKPTPSRLRSRRLRLTEELPGNHGFWAEEFDLSALSYPQFLAFFFDRPVVGDKEQYELFRWRDRLLCRIESGDRR